MKKEAVGKIQPIKKSNTNLILAIIILLLLVIFVLAYYAYDYFKKLPLQGNQTEQNESYVNDTTPINDSNINDTLKPRIAVCGNGKCEAKENYTNCPADCRRPGSGGGGNNGGNNTPPSCTPNCTNKQCGSDRCSGTCPPGCNAGYECNSTGNCSLIPCTNDTGCDSAGAFFCSGNSVYNCSNLDADICLERTNLTSCASGWQCINGTGCIETKECAAATVASNCSSFFGACSYGICNATKKCEIRFNNSDIICKASTGPCDYAAKCSGSSAACPSNPFNLTLDICKTSTGVCDAAEKCSGSSAACPTDSFNLSTTMCRTNISDCDAKEFCLGDNAICPIDTNESNGETCFGGTCQSGKCTTTCTDTCTSLGYECGNQLVCQQTVNCGSCRTGETCNSSGRCVVTCTPSCAGKQCGIDGCGGSCFPGCSAGYECNASGQCVSGLGNLIYVDKNLAADCTTYNPSTRSCGSGNFRAYNTISEAANAAVAGTTVIIRAGTYHERLIPANSGSAGNYITYTSYPGESATLDGTGVAYQLYDGAVHIISKSYINISGLSIKNVYNSINKYEKTYGIRLSSADHIIIENNYVYNTCGPGIQTGSSSNITINNNEFELNCNGCRGEIISIATTNTFEVKNNYVHNGGLGYISSPPEPAGGDGGEGIDVKEGSSNGKVYSNTIHNLAEDMGIYLDTYGNTKKIEIYNNKIYNSREGIALSTETSNPLENIKIHNNLAYNNDKWGFNICGYGAGTKRNIEMLNNVAYNNNIGGIYACNRDYYNISIKNNIMSKNKDYQLVIADSDSISEFNASNNLIDGFRGYANEIYGNHPVIGDPLFAAPVNDFHLQSPSPAIDAGINVGINKDFDGNPIVGNPDIGAYEYQGTGSYIYAVDGTREGIQDAINLAKTGDTVVVPAGTWNVSGKIYLTDKINIKGSGMEKTLLIKNDSTNDPIFEVQSVLGSGPEISDLSFIGIGEKLWRIDNSSTIRDVGIEFLGKIVNFSVHDCLFTGFGQAGIMFDSSYWASPGHSKGVIYKNRFIDNLYRSPTISNGYGVLVWGDLSDWSMNLGSEDAVFIEDNYFERCRHSVAAGNAARYVFRYNTVYNNYYPWAAADAHGKYWSAHGTRSYEIYNNNISQGIESDTLAPHATWAVGIRGGDGVIFNNSFEGGRENNIFLTIEQLGNDDNVTYTYPIPDQTTDLWLWKNVHDGAPYNTIYIYDSLNRNMTNYLQEGRDYHFAIKPGYTPYTYPHPLRQKALQSTMLLQSEQASPLSLSSQIWSLIESIFTGNTIKEITGYFLRIKA